MAATAVLSQHRPEELWENYLANLEALRGDDTPPVSVDDYTWFKSQQEMERFLALTKEHPDRDFAHHVAFLTYGYEDLKGYLIASHEETRRLIREQLSRARTT